MDAGVNDDQRLIMETSARFIREVCPLTGVRRNAYREARFAADYWRQAAELGWFSMLVPERLGGGSASGNGADGRGPDRLRTRPRPAAWPVCGHQCRGLRPRRRRFGGPADHGLAGLLSGRRAGGLGALQLTVTAGGGATVRAVRTGTGYELSGLGCSRPGRRGGLVAAGDRGRRRGGAPVPPAAG